MLATAIMKNEYFGRKGDRTMSAFKWLLVAYATVGFSSCALAQAIEVDGHKIQQATELIVVPLIIACIIWVVWKVREKKRQSDKADLDEAWHTVLSDPNYLHRRRYEEYKSEVDSQARKAEAQARKIESLGDNVG